MEFVFCDFRQFQNREAQTDRSVDDCFGFMLSSRYKIVVDNTPVEYSGLSYEFHCTSRIGNQFEVYSFTEAFHGFIKQYIVEVFVVRL